MQVIEQGSYDFRRQRNRHDRRMSIVARENISNVETDMTKELKLPEFLPEENYKMSTKELVQSSNDAFNYSLAVIMKINSALYDIYMV